MVLEISLPMELDSEALFDRLIGLIRKIDLLQNGVSLRPLSKWKMERSLKMLRWQTMLRINRLWKASLSLPMQVRVIKEYLVAGLVKMPIERLSRVLNLPLLNMFQGFCKKMMTQA